MNLGAASNQNQSLARMKYNIINQQKMKILEKSRPSALGAPMVNRIHTTKPGCSSCGGK
jgi:hypothetical protein